MDTTDLNASYIEDDGAENELVRRGSRVHNDSFLGTEVERPVNPRGTSTPGAVFIVMNATLGAAILSLPYAANQCGGLLVFLIMQYSLAVLAAFAMIILAKCADIGNASVYQEVIETMTKSDMAVLFTRFMIALYAFSSCVAYLVLIGDQGEKIAKYILGSETYEEHSEMYRKLIILALGFVIVLPLMLPRTISFLEMPGVVSFFSVLYLVLAIVCLYFFGDDVKPLDVHVKTSPDSGKAIFNSLPTIAFGYQCHVSGVPVYCSLKHRNLKTWTFVLLAATAMSSLLYSVTTIFGYLTFGDQIQGDILLNYSDSNIPMVIARLGVMVSVMMSYPTIHYCGRICLEDVYRKIFGLSNSEGNRTWTVRYYVQTFTWFVLSLVGALFIPGIDKVVDIIGAFAAFFILGFPGLCAIRYGVVMEDAMRDSKLKDKHLVVNLSEDMKTHTKNKGHFFMVVGSIYIVLCAFLFGEALTSGIMNLF